VFLCLDGEKQRDHHSQRELVTLVQSVYEGALDGHPQYSLTEKDLVRIDHCARYQSFLPNGLVEDYEKTGRDGLPHLRNG
jgi:hypothetical protein